MIVKLFCSLAVLSICLPAIVSAKPQSDDVFQNTTDSCESIFNEMSTLVEPVLLIGEKSFPITEAAIDNHCKLGNDFYKRARKYGKCLKGLARQALQIYLSGLRKFIRSICTSPAKKQNAINDLKCSTPETIDGWNNCLHIANRQLDFVSDNSTSVGVVGDVCCVYSHILKCIGQHTGTKPDCSPTADATKFFKTSIALILREVIELICSKYSTEEECIANNPEGLAKIQSVASSNATVNGAFLISPLIKIVNKLSDDSDA